MEEPNENSPLERRVQSDDPTLTSRASIEDYSSLSAGLQSIRKKESWTVYDLLHTQFPEPDWLVPGMIPNGLTVLGGRPKIGKSFLAIDLAIAKANGGIFLGRSLSPGKVLYLALEDRPPRLQKRLIKLNAPEATHILFTCDAPKIKNGETKSLIRLIDENTVSLVVIDTLTRVFGRVDQDELGVMSEIFSNLQDIAQDKGIAILGIDHHRKPNGYLHDPVDDLLGSTGKSAPLDTVLGLYRDRGTHYAKLMVTGRDVEDQELRLVWDCSTWKWGLEDETGEDCSRKKRVCDAIEELSTHAQQATPTYISQLTGIDVANVSHLISDLMQEGKVKKGSKIGVAQPYLPVNDQMNGMSEQE